MVNLPALVPAHAAIATPATSRECVILLHGLGRDARSMEPLADAFRKRNYPVANVDYASRSAPIGVLSERAVDAGVRRCPPNATLHFVTHSLGGILVRYYLAAHGSPHRLGRVVMLAPPNHGSEVVDELRDTWYFDWFAGDAGRQLGTDGLPGRLGPVDYELGVVAGTRPGNPFFAPWLPEPHDGLVSVESTRVPGMRDFAAVPYPHRVIMRQPEVMALALAFVETGRFPAVTD